MRKFCNKLNKRQKFLAIGILAVMALFIALSGGLVLAGGMALATALPVLTDEDAILVAHVKEQMSTELQKFEKGYITQTKLDDFFEEKLIEVQESGISKKDFDELKASFEAQGIELNAMKVKEVTPTTFKSAIKEAFAAEGIAQKIKDVFKAGAGIIEITKAVANITTGAASTDTGGNALLDLINADDVQTLRLRDQFIENYCTVTRTSKPVYTYADWVPKDGDVDFVLEAGTKPQLDLKVEVRTATPKKAAGHEILTDESIDDIPRMESEARVLLFKKYLLRRQRGILFGDGTGANPLGITEIAGAFNPATWTGDKKSTPNLYDAIIAFKNQIETASNYTDDIDYYPNVVFINHADYNALLIKQDDKVYTFNQIQGTEPVRVAGIEIVAKKEIPVGYMLIGDFKMLHVVNYIDYNLKIGYINDQMINNLFTMVGEGRFYVIVKYYDQLAFGYDTIQNVIDGITEVAG